MLMSILPYLIGGTGILSFGAILFLILIVKKASSKKKEESPQTEEISAKRFDSPLKIRQSFTQATTILKKTLSKHDYPYKTPWFLVIGESGAGKSTLLRHTGMNLPLGEFQNSETDSKIGVQWWFFDKGLVIEPNGDFVIKSDGKTANENGFQNILKLLKKHRPDRPIDGIILTIPATDLLSDPDNPDFFDQVIKEKTEMLYSKMWTIQRELAIHFPVYVLFTKAEKIDGFSSFCKQLPLHFHENILGWSNPHSLDSVYSRNWIQDAMKKLNQSIFHTQMEVFAERNQIDGVNSLFFFPNTFHKIEAHLQRMMEIIFKESAYHDSFFLRGFYFSSSISDKTSDKPVPLFLNHLFEKKIFPERGLAKMVNETMVSKHRRMRIVQVACALLLVFGSAGMIYSYVNLNSEKEKIVPILSLISSTLGELNNKQAIDHSLFKKKAIHLLNGMTRVQPDNLFLILIPASWGSTLQSEIVGATTIAYEKIIMRFMNIDLNDRAKTLGFKDSIASDRDDNSVQGYAVEDTAEFKALYRFINNLEELERHIKLYNARLATGQADSSEFAQVVKFLLDIELEEAFSQDALKKLQGENIDTEILKANANAKVWELSRLLFDRVFKYNPLDQKLVALEKQLNDITKKNKRKEEHKNILQFQELVKSLQELERYLAQDEIAWTVQQKLDLGSKFEQIKAAVENSTILGLSVRVELEKRSQAEFEQLKLTLKSRRSQLTDHLLYLEDEQPVLKLSKQLAEFKKALEDYFVLKFAIIDEVRMTMKSEPPLGSYLLWDSSFLEEGEKLYESYTTFITERLKNFPRNLQTIFERIARQSLEINMVSLIGQSQQFEPDIISQNPSQVREILRKQVLNFKEASPHLAKLLNIFDKLELHDSNRDLFHIVAHQGNLILSTVDKQLQQKNFYMMQNADFSWWNGQPSPSLAAYNVNDEEEMAYYLRLQREQISFLALESAKPVIDFMGYQYKFRGNVKVKLVNKWQRIIRSIEDYKGKKPGNSPDVLEKFIAKELDSIVAEGCLKRLNPSVLKTRSQDYFLKKRNYIRSRLYLRCQEIANKRQLRVF